MKIISGMHRSGTSILARLFFEAGADLGNPKTFYPGDKWNPDGYFEQVDIHKVNMPLINGPWGKLTYFKLPSTNTILQRSEKLAPLIKKLGEKYQGKVIKETRFCLTLPAWLKYNVEIEKVLICLRSPVEVANSIKKRNKTTLNHGLNLWYTHNARLLENIKNIPSRIVSYKHLLNEETSLNEIKGAFNFFDINLPEEKIIDLKKRLIKTNMNHNANSKCEYPQKIELLWSKLQKMHDNQPKF